VPYSTQVLYGDLEPARALFAKFMSVWRKYGFVPEAFNVQTGEPQEGLKQYPLRPEMAESAFYLHRATGDDEYRLVCLSLSAQFAVISNVLFEAT
jgi:mannosidase alpha-like ER degradation enhancer 2